MRIVKRKAKVDAYQAFMKEPRNAAIVHDFIDHLRRHKERDATILAAMERDGETPSSAAMEQLRRYAQARARYMKEVPLLRSSQVADLSGSKARNGSAKASRWKKERRIFSVRWNGVDYYPAFQFSTDGGTPLPAVQTVLKILGEKHYSEWQIAFWFWSNNGCLRDARAPMDVITNDPAAVIDAARAEIEPFSG
jgi:hypothetical protein